MPVSKAKQAAVRRYKEKTYDRISVEVPKGEKTEYQAHASTCGESLNGFVNRAIAETIKRDRNSESK